MNSVGGVTHFEDIHLTDSALLPSHRATHDA